MASRRGDASSGAASRYASRTAGSFYTWSATSMIRHTLGEGRMGALSSPLWGLPSGRPGLLAASRTHGLTAAGTSLSRSTLFFLRTQVVYTHCISVVTAPMSFSCFPCSVGWRFLEERTLVRAVPSRTADIPGCGAAGLRGRQHAPSSAALRAYLFCIVHLILYCAQRFS